MSVDKATLDKLKKILKVSKSIKMEQMRGILRMDKEAFDDKIIDWAAEFGFEIDREYVNINKSTVDDFIDELDSQFEAWGLQEATGIGKVKSSESEKKFDYLAKKEEEEREKARKKTEEKEKQLKIENQNIVNQAQQKFNEGQWDDTINLFKKSKVICAQQGWSDGIKYAGEMIVKAKENARKEAEIKRRREAEERKKKEKTRLETEERKRREEQEERTRQEAEKRTKGTVPFRDVQIPQLEADVLQELEKQSGKQLNSYYLGIAKIGFRVINNRVTTISLFKCGLSTLPESIGDLKSLQTLWLSNNNLRTLPESIGQLSSLQTLYLDNNQLSTLPESIGDLSSLEKLIIYFNQLSTLPESMNSMSSLKELNISENPLKSRAKSVLKKLKKKGVYVSKGNIK